MPENIFLELSIVIIIAVFTIGIVRILKQPIIIGYIITGILVSPTFFDIVKSVDIFRTLSEIGVALLLFMVGIHLNPKIIKEVGKVSLITGMGQVLFTSLIGFGMVTLLGFKPLTAIYIAVAMAFSSTIIITKLLSDKGDLNKLYGKISIGFLIVQDIIVVIVLMLISSTSGGGTLAGFAVRTFAIGTALIVGLFLLSYAILPGLTRPIAKSSEFLLIFALGWCFAIASLFEYFSFSIEIGALLAGMTLSLSPYRYEISAKLKPIRDFFIFIFFIWLGLQLEFSNITAHIPAIIILSIFILIGNPFIVMSLMGSLKYKKRTSFLAGLTVAQISEFSLILIALGVKMGHLTSDILSLVTVVGLVTITGSTYFIMYADKIYPHFSNILSIFERKKTIDEREIERKRYDIILFGAHRAGHDIFEALKTKKKSLLIIDHNPDVVNKLMKRGYNCIYGDISDVDLLEEIDLCNAKMVISTVPDAEINLLFMRRVKLCNHKAIILVVANTVKEALNFYKQGANYVITPKFIGGKEISDKIKNNKFNLGSYKKEKDTHITHLNHLKKYE
jgi:Kef-type K+ transport system membrane component KefB